MLNGRREKDRGCQREREERKGRSKGKGEEEEKKGLRGILEGEGAGG